MQCYNTFELRDMVLGLQCLHVVPGSSSLAFLHRVPE